MLQEIGRGLDSNELKLRTFADELLLYLAGGNVLVLPILVRWEREEEDEVEVKSRVIVGRELGADDDEKVEFGK